MWIKVLSKHKKFCTYQYCLMCTSLKALDHKIKTYCCNTGPMFSVALHISLTTQIISQLNYCTGNNWRNSFPSYMY